MYPSRQPCSRYAGQERQTSEHGRAAVLRPSTGVQLENNSAAFAVLDGEHALEGWTKKLLGMTKR